MATLVQERAEKADLRSELDRALEREIGNIVAEAEANPATRRTDAKLYYTMPLAGVKYYSYKPRPNK